MFQNYPRLTAVFQALFVTFLWATSFVLIKIGLVDIPALTFAGLRYTLAVVCLIPIVLRYGFAATLYDIPRRTWAYLFGLGLLLYAGTQGAMFVSLVYLPAVTVNLLWTFSNVVVALLGIALLAERPTWLQWLGVVIATVGALIYFYPIALQGSQLFGVFVAVVGVCANASAAILGRHVNRSGNLHPLIVTIVSMGIGSIILLTSAILTQGLPSLGLSSWAIIAWLAVVNTAFAFTLWNHTLRTLSAMESSIINSTMLIWIPILAVIFLGERITEKELIGLALAGIGMLLVQLRRSVILLQLWKSRVQVQRLIERAESHKGS